MSQYFDTCSSAFLPASFSFSAVIRPLYKWDKRMRTILEMVGLLEPLITKMGRVASLRWLRLGCRKWAFGRVLNFVSLRLI